MAQVFLSPSALCSAKLAGRKTEGIRFYTECGPRARLRAGSAAITQVESFSGAWPPEASAHLRQIVLTHLAVERLSQKG